MKVSYGEGWYSLYKQVAPASYLSNVRAKSKQFTRYNAPTYCTFLSWPAILLVLIVVFVPKVIHYVMLWSMMVSIVPLLIYPFQVLKESGRNTFEANILSLDRSNVTTWLGSWLLCLSWMLLISLDHMGWFIQFFITLLNLGKMYFGQFRIHLVPLTPKVYFWTS